MTSKQFMFGNPEFFSIIKTENKQKYLKNVNILNIHKISSNREEKANAIVFFIFVVNDDNLSLVAACRSSKKLQKKLT